MSASREQLEWFQRYADGLASRAEVAQLQAALHANEELRRAFLEYLDVDSALEEAAAAVEFADVSVPPRTGHASRPEWRVATWIGVAATVTLASLYWAVPRRSAEVAANVVRSEGVVGLTEGAPVRLGVVKIDDGALTVRLVESGVLLNLVGPLQAHFETSMRLRVQHGRVSADVGERGAGFTVVTDAGEVVDLGTSFAVEAERGGESRVAVFSGQVKVRTGGAAEARAFTTLSEGEAVRFSAAAGLRRWEQVAMAAEAAGIAARSQSAVVATVRDNLGEGTLRPFYGVVAGGMRRGSLAFTDKPNPRWAPAATDALPSWLEGADLVRTYHQFRHRRHYELALTLREPATVFVLVDVRQAPPAWLTERFTNTEVEIVVGPWQQGLRTEPGVDTRADGLPYLSYAVWRCDAEPGELKLGAPRDQENNRMALMYGVAVKARAPRFGELGR